MIFVYILIAFFIGEAIGTFSGYAVGKTIGRRKAFHKMRQTYQYGVMQRPPGA